MQFSTVLQLKLKLEFIRDIRTLESFGKFFLIVHIIEHFNPELFNPKIQTQTFHNQSFHARILNFQP